MIALSLNQLNTGGHRPPLQPEQISNCRLLRLRPVRAERTSLAGEPLFQTGRAIAVIARPAFGAIQVAAAASCMRILHLQQVEILFPVRTFFSKRRGTVTNLNP